MVAFANDDGGLLVIGVSDTGKIIGVPRVSNKKKSEIQDVASNCDPSVEIRLEELNLNGKNLLLIQVPGGKDKPYSCKQGFFLRIGANSQKLSRNKVHQFMVDLNKIRFDEKTCPDFDFVKDFDEAKLKAFLEKQGLDTELDNEKVLLNLGVAVKTGSRLEFNNAGVMLFAKQPQNFVRQSYISCTRFHGTSKVSIIDRKDFQGDLVSMVREAEAFAKKHTKIASKIVDFKRVDIEEYPYEAIREAIVNAVCHRSYFYDTTGVFVNLFDDRIEVSSPGGIPYGLKLSDVLGRSYPRNYLLADLFKSIGWVEKLGTGIQRMKKLMKEHGLQEPQIESTKGFFQVTFFAPENLLDLIKTGKETDLKKEGLNDRQINALNYAQKEGSITSQKYSELNEVTKRTANRDINQLIEAGYFKQVGKTRNIVFILTLSQNKLK